MTLSPDFIILFANLMSRDYTTAPESICILRLSAIGDCCHTLTVVRTLQDAFPDTPITWVTGTTEYKLLQGSTGIEFITFDKNGGFAAWRELRRQLHGRSFSLLLNMNASLRANFVSTAIPARRRVGFDSARARDFQWAFCNEQIAPMQPGRRHVLDGLFQFADHLGVTERTLRWDIPTGDQDRTFAASHIAGGRPTVIISPCSSQRARNFRNWSVENYVTLITWLQEQHQAQVILTGANSDIELQYEREIMAQSEGEVTSLIGKTSLKQLFALIETADLVICPDSGPAHMATAAGTHVVGLYATSNPERTGPYLDRDLTVNRYPEAIKLEFGKDVSEVRYGQRVRTPDAMDLITRDDVTAKIQLVFAAG